VGNEVYSNVTITAVTATDIYFTYSGGMGNEKLERLGPELQKRFHFDPKKARKLESEEQKATVSFRSGFRSSPQVNTNKSPVSTRDPQPYIAVQASDVTVQYKDYDPIYDRPRDLYESGMARIDRDFSFDVDFTVHPVAQTNKDHFAFQIDSTKISIGLTMTFTEPSSPTLKLKNHLEGLKHIYEHFYELGPKAAERAGHFVGSGLWIQPDAKDPASAEEIFLSRARSAAQTEYWNYIKFPAESAKQYYEDLTDNGEGLADSEQAVREAIQRAEFKIPDGPIDPTPTWLELRQ
jgi:hypothetical protein